MRAGPMCQWGNSGFGKVRRGVELRGDDLAAHVYGKPIVAAKLLRLTTMKMAGASGNIKDIADWAFCEGINRFFIIVMPCNRG